MSSGFYRRPVEIVALFSVLTACAAAHDRDGMECASGPYGFERCRLLSDMSDSELDAFCRWYSDLHGGEHRQQNCPDWVITYYTREECMLSFSGVPDACSVAVAHSEDCFQLHVDSPCAPGVPDTCRLPAECIP